jgi:phosphate transport system substrate-binding protein
VAFALSKLGQEAVETTRFVAMRPRLGSWRIPSNAPREYVEFAKDAERLDVNFRFESASSQLDNKALSDLDRLVDALKNPPLQGRYVLLFGFADSTGTTQMNLSLSKARAETVSQQFHQRGISPAVVAGFGKELPVDSNETEEGKQKNRRVEIWLRR